MGDPSKPEPVFVIQYIIPILSIIVILLSPVLLLFHISGPEGVKGSLGKPLSQLSWLIIVLSIPLCLSSYERNNLSTYAFYCVLLALANMAAENMERKRVWLVLAIWHAVNLLNLIGGRYSILQFYATGNNGLILDVYSVPDTGKLGGTSGLSGDCEGAAGTYCSNSWVMIQMIIAFLYIVLHVIAFFVVVVRAVKYNDVPEDWTDGRGLVGDQNDRSGGVVMEQANMQG